MSTFSQKTLDENIQKYVVYGMRPLSTVDNKHFRKLITDLAPNAKIMSRRTLGRQITDKFVKVSDKLKQELKNVKYVSTTADIWSNSHRSYLGVTVHWVTYFEYILKASSYFLFVNGCYLLDT